MNQTVISPIRSGLEFLPFLREEKMQEVRVVYDTEADVLYINFGKDNFADDSDPLESEIIQRTHAGKVVGYTILNASRKQAEQQ